MIEKRQRDSLLNVGLKRDIDAANRQRKFYRIRRETFESYVTDYWLIESMIPQLQKRTENVDYLICRFFRDAVTSRYVYVIWR
jgi:hypothetical protein